MKPLLKILITLLVFTLVGCGPTIPASKNNNLEITGSGRIISQDRPLSGFDQIETSLPFTLTIRRGADYRVRLYADDNIIDYIAVTQSGPRITFGFQPGYAYSTTRLTLRAEVTLPTLSELHLNGSSHAVLEGFETTTPLAAYLSGASVLTGELTASTVELALTGNSGAALTGACETLHLEVHGSARADLSSFKAGEALVKTSGVSQTHVYAARRLNVDASQNSQVIFLGNPHYQDIQHHEHATASAQLQSQ